MLYAVLMYPLAYFYLRGVMFPQSYPDWGMPVFAARCKCFHQPLQNYRKTIKNACKTICSVVYCKHHEPWERALRRSETVRARNQEVYK